MSFGGAAQAMITSLKNNKRKRKTIYDNQDHLHYKNDGFKFSERKATPEQMAELRKKIAKGKKVELRKTIISLVLAAIFLVVVFFLLTY